MSKLFSYLFLGIIFMYQKIISPLIPPRCRYTPTCSEYGKKVIHKYGPWKGGKLAVKRILRCHPWGGHGYDPLP